MRRQLMKRELMIALILCIVIAGILLAGILLVDHIKKVRREELFRQMREDTFMQPYVPMEEENLFSNEESGLNAEEER